jgi:GAF domain-containing protein
MRFRAAYAEAFAAHLAGPGEHTLHQAYELGRRAVAEQLSVLELADAHHDVLAGALGGPGAGEAAALAATAGRFFSETLSAYEMVQRGYREARATAALERRQARTIRRLSTFLEDASLASDSAGTLGEVLQLIAEEARELVGAAGCIVAVRSNSYPPWASGSSPAELVAVPGQRRDAQLLAVHALLHAEGSAVRLDADVLPRHPQIARLGEDVRVRGWLGAPLRHLGGGLIGSIQLFDWEDGAPTELDEAVIVHLAQMAAATVERTLLYR